jgi:hypothetical protein
MAAEFRSPGGLPPAVAPEENPPMAAEFRVAAGLRPTVAPE